MVKKIKIGRYPNLMKRSKCTKCGTKRFRYLMDIVGVADRGWYWACADKCKKA